MISKRTLLAKAGIAIFVVWLLAGCSASSNAGHPSPPRAEEGVFDLRAWRLADDGPVALDGAWDWLPHRLLAPEKLRGLAPEDRKRMELPGGWERETLDGRWLSPTGVATYRLTLLWNEQADNPILALSLSDISMSYRLWIDGKLAAVKGVAADSSEAYAPKDGTKIVYFQPHGASTELVLEVANFDFRSGGITHSIKLGTASRISQNYFAIVGSELFVCGSVFLIGIYHLVMFANRRKDRASLFFALFCLLLGQHILFTGETVINNLVPAMSWVVKIRIEYIGVYLGMPLFAYFVRSLFPNETSKWLTAAFAFLGLAWSVATLAAPPIAFTYWMHYFQYLVVAFSASIAVSMILAVVRSRDGSLYMTLGSIPLFAAVLIDILYSQHLIGSGDMRSLGLFVFTLIQSANLSVQHARAHVRLEKAATEWSRLNATLEEKVRERTMELEQSQERLRDANRILERLSYIDSLTNIANRRFFDEAMEKEWASAIRNQTPLSVIMADIDYFKEFNDTYGHPFGDEVLGRIAQSFHQLLARPRDLVARYGGEEFIMVLPETDRVGAMHVAQEAVEMVRELAIPHAASEIADIVTVSLGVTTAYPTNRWKIKQFLKRVDQALYEAKEKGRDQACYHESEDEDRKDSSGEGTGETVGDGNGD